MDLYIELSKLKQIQQEMFNMVKELHTNNGVTDNKNKLYDLTDLERVLKIGRRTLFKHLSSGILTHSKIGKKIYVDEKSLQEFLTSNKQGNFQS
jgi:hypothetical protein